MRQNEKNAIYKKFCFSQKNKQKEKIKIQFPPQHIFVFFVKS
jgi:hypothetical protein